MKEEATSWGKPCAQGAASLFFGIWVVWEVDSASGMLPEGLTN